MKQAKPKATRKQVVLIFGEDENDRETMRQLAMGIRKDLPSMEKRRDPLVLMKERGAAAQKKNAQSIAQQVQRDRKRFDVRGLIAHQDCDALEPAHIELATTIRERLASIGVEIVPATPAWETETWLFLWPDAAIAHVPLWRRPARTGTDVGRLENAKESYRRDVRRKDRQPVRDYVESDAPQIIMRARELGILGSLDAQSESFDAFRKSLVEADF